ncbi:hypothetical protein ACISSW_21105, partial [Escherichia coli]
NIPQQKNTPANFWAHLRTLGKKCRKNGKKKVFADDAIKGRSLATWQSLDFDILGLGIFRLSPRQLTR